MGSSRAQSSMRYLALPVQCCSRYVSFNATSSSLSSDSFLSMFVLKLARNGMNCIGVPSNFNCSVDGSRLSIRTRLNRAVADSS